MVRGYVGLCVMRDVGECNRGGLLGTGSGEVFIKEDGRGGGLCRFECDRRECDAESGCL